jgi:hypothetical protein
MQPVPGSSAAPPPRGPKSVGQSGEKSTIGLQIVTILGVMTLLLGLAGIAVWALVEFPEPRPVVENRMGDDDSHSETNTPEPAPGDAHQAADESPLTPSSPNTTDASVARPPTIMHSPASAADAQPSSVEPTIDTPAPTVDVPIASRLWSKPEEAAYFVVTDDKLWDLRSQQAVAEWTYAPNQPQLVLASPDHLASIDKGSRGKVVTLYRPNGESISTHDMVHDEGVPKFDDYWLACQFIPGDCRRVVLCSEGDLWRGTFDWKTGKLVDIKRITQIGLFRGKQVLHWHGNRIWLWGEFDKQKPVVSIDLMTGTLEEITTLDVFTPRVTDMTVNPAGTLLARATEDAIYTYRLDKNTTRAYPNAVLVPTGSNIRPTTTVPAATHSSSLKWISDGKAIAEVGYENSVVLDFHNEQPIVVSHRGYAVQGIVPGGEYIDIAPSTLRPNRPDRPTPTSRMLVSLLDGTRSPLPIPPQATTRWLDGDRVLYIRNDGGLSEIGSWLYQRSTGQSLRLTHHQLRIDALGWIPELQWICGLVQGGSHVKIELREDGMVQASPIEIGMSPDGTIRDGFIRVINTNPLDLGLSVSASEPWAESGDVIAGSPQSQGELTDLQLVRQALENESAEAREFGIQAYEFARDDTLLGNFYQPSKVALKFVAAYRERPTTRDDFGSLTTDLDLSDCVNGDGAYAYFLDRASSMFALESSFGDRPEVHKQVCETIAKVASEAFVQRPRQDIGYVDALFGAAVEQVVARFRE